MVNAALLQNSHVMRHAIRPKAMSIVNNFKGFDFLGLLLSMFIICLFNDLGHCNVSATFFTLQELFVYIIVLHKPSKETLNGLPEKSIYVLLSKLWLDCFNRIFCVCESRIQDKKYPSISRGIICI